MPKIIKFGWDFTKLYQFNIKQMEMCSFLAHPVDAVAVDNLRCSNSPIHTDIRYRIGLIRLILWLHKIRNDFFSGTLDWKASLTPHNGSGPKSRNQWVSNEFSVITVNYCRLLAHSFFAARTHVVTWLSVCLCVSVCHVDVLCRKDRIDHHATFSKL